MSEIDRRERPDAHLAHPAFEQLDLKPRVPSSATPFVESEDDMQTITETPYVIVAIGFFSTFSAWLGPAWMSVTSPIPSTLDGAHGGKVDPTNFAALIDAIPEDRVVVVNLKSNRRVVRKGLPRQ